MKKSWLGRRCARPVQTSVNQKSHNGPIELKVTFLSQAYTFMNLIKGVAMSKDVTILMFASHNAAKDDAAGLAIASSMTSHVRGLHPSIRN